MTGERFDKDEHLRVKCYRCGHGRRFEVLEPGDDGVGGPDQARVPDPVRLP